MRHLQLYSKQQHHKCEVIKQERIQQLILDLTTFQAYGSLYGVTCLTCEECEALELAIDCTLRPYCATGHEALCSAEETGELCLECLDIYRMEVDFWFTVLEKVGRLSEAAGPKGK